VTDVIEPVPLWKQPVSYGAIGGTQASDLLDHPPAGYRPIRRRTRIGHGDNRFTWASTQVMSWGVQRLSGIVVDVTDAPPQVTEATYVPVSFDDAGVPVTAAGVGIDGVGAAGEDTFGADGTSFLVPGDTAVLTIRFLGIAVTAPVRVVYVVDEPTRRGFAYGTLDGHPESGEESFVVDRTDDGSVWITITAFSRPSAWYWWALYLPLRVAQEMYTRRYLRVLSGPTD
jgi:uncharacterized protein (UPF0548 family)